MIRLSDAAHRRPSVYFEEHWHSDSVVAPFAKALASGKIRYFVKTNRSSPKNVDIAFDFEVAMRVWLKALDLQHIQLARAAELDGSDLLINFTGKSLDSQGFDTHAQYAIMDDGRPCIELKANAAAKSPGRFWMSIPQLFATKVYFPHKHGEKSRTALEIFGENDGDPDAIAEHLLRTKNKVSYNAAVRFNKFTGELTYLSFLHEIGHVFGLADLYRSEEVPYKTPGYESVMKCGAWCPLYPTAIDVKRALKLLDELANCEGLLLR